ncbi:hypothetical protein NCAS_0G00730 [Naumovozyma castellii]|uniref:Uncharacterized protein n=1 Tax=Naumovozyma castellii TaxID=27288 RepID=G0VHS6_NAUCA|nr:hypothetical protein NCAS_0G00730 [Naumovozyma castellii CBS 4309]CCC70960.1 hypothetical protein NCAS_0G00730 [Naumovozyma castellii CBS 4309]
MGLRRNPRGNPHITKFIIDTTAKIIDLKKIQLQKLDLLNFNLSLLYESQVAALIKDPAQYDHEQAGVWWSKIPSFQAFHNIIGSITDLY